MGFFVSVIAEPKVLWYKCKNKVFLIKHKKMAFADDKQTIIDIVKANKCPDSHFIQDNANSYEELAFMLFEFSKTFDCNPAYLETLLDTIDDAILLAQNIYYKRTGVTITNPKWVVACTDVVVVVNVDRQEIDIAANSTVTMLTIANSKTIELLNIGGGSIVARLDVQNGSCVTVLLVKSCGIVTSELLKVTEGSCIENIGIDTDAIYGGYECVINNAPQ